MEQHEITAPDVRLHYVRLTNHLDVPFTDRWDGVPVNVLPGKSSNFELAMAAHFFGNVMDEQASFRHVCKRQGWNTPGHLKASEEDPSKSVAELLYSKLEIKPVIYKMVEEKPDLEQPIPADPQAPQVTKELASDADFLAEAGKVGILERSPATDKPPRPVIKYKPGYGK
jgi:hypothetical protein